jgi:hydrogenase-4 membrane subunit HyfE
VRDIVAPPMATRRGTPDNLAALSLLLMTLLTQLREGMERIFQVQALQSVLLQVISAAGNHELSPRSLLPA